MEKSKYEKCGLCGSKSLEKGEGQFRKCKYCGAVSDNFWYWTIPERRTSPFHEAYANKKELEDNIKNTISKMISEFGDKHKITPHSIVVTMLNVSNSDNELPKYIVSDCSISFGI